MKSELDMLLYAAKKEKTAELQLERLLPGIMEKAGQKQNGIDTLPRKNNRLVLTKQRRRIMRYCSIGAVAAAAVLVVLINSNRTKEIVVEGKTYLTKGTTVVIDGIEYSTQQSAENAQLILLEDNEYIIAPTQKEQAEVKNNVMVFPVGTEMHDIEKEVQAYEMGIYSIEPVPMYPMASDLVIRSGPGVEHAEIGIMYNGQCVQKVGMHNAWAIIEWNGEIAYAFDKYLFEAPTELPAYAPVIKYATELVNIRSIPTSRDESRIIGELDVNIPIQCTGEIGKWTQVKVDGSTGYIFTQYLQTARSGA